MPITLRPYQQEAVDAAISHVKKRLSPCLLELSVGSGKSLIVAELATFFTKVAPTKKVLCIAPSKELIEQNHELYTEGYGYQASIYCASAGMKCTRQQVIFCSPQSALGSIDKIAHMGVSAIVIDEAHMITNSVKKLIDAVLNYELKGEKINDKCRIIGTTGTPYRMGTGYIYAIDAAGESEIHMDESKAVDPYFSKLLYRVATGGLVGEGFLSDIQIGDIETEYDTSSLKKNNMGQFTPGSVATVFDGSSKTERIINEVIEKSQDKMGVMIFASTVEHAKEILSYLPEGSEMITGSMKKKERTSVINSFKRREFKFIVNKDILVTGFNATHVDVIAILRATESPGLFQQVVGRGLRLHDDKEFMLLLDYAENIERHSLQSDIFTPEIKAKRKSEDGEEIQVICPSCNAVSMKKRRNDPMYAGMQHDRFGNYLVAGTEEAIGNGEFDGMVLTTQVLDPSTKDEFGECGFKEIPVPAHYSRRCSNPEAYIMSGKPIACDHRFSYKTCPDCLTDNDIAARHCTGCKARLVDPNEKLSEKAGVAGVLGMGEIKVISCGQVKYEAFTSQAGNKSLKATYVTEIGSITAWHTKKQHWVFNRLARANGCDLEVIDHNYTQCDFWTVAPNAIKVKKSEGQNGYAKFEVREVIFDKKEEG